MQDRKGPLFPVSHAGKMSIPCAVLGTISPHSENYACVKSRRYDCTKEKEAPVGV